MKTLTIALTLLATPVHAAELVLFEFDGCLWCEQWKRDVGGYYAKTAEGKIAPIVLADLFDPRPARFQSVYPVRATPTFVLVDKGREIGRITGYSDPESFWVDLGKLLAKRAP